MKRTLRLSEAAIADLLAIREWIAGESDLERAQSFVDRIRTKTAKLVETPFLGEAALSLKPGLLKLSFERRYVVLYRVLDEEILVDRILSTRRDLDSLN